MEKILQLIVMSAIIIAMPGYAQERKASTRSVCTQRCNDGLLERAPKYGEQLNKVRAAIAKETDPEKLQELKKQEKEEAEKLQDKIEQLCRDICKNNPE